MSSTAGWTGLPRTGFLVATRAQALLLLRSRRPALLVAIVAVVVGVALVRFAGYGDDWSVDLAFTPGRYQLLLLVGAVWGILVWHEEGPRSRGYHWRMPLDTAVHDVARVLAGIAWLGVGVGLYMAWVVGMSVAAGSVDELVTVTPLAWAGLAANALLGYLLLAGLSTAIDKALEVGLLASVTLLVATFELAVDDHPLPTVLEPVRWLLDAVFLGEYGLLTVMQGTATRGGSGPGGVGPSDPAAVTSPGTWAAATALWLIAAAGAISLATLWNRRR